MCRMRGYGDVTVTKCDGAMSSGKTPKKRIIKGNLSLAPKIKVQFLVF